MIKETDIKKCLEVIKEDSKYVSKCSHLSYFPLVIAKGNGSIITDVDGNEFIDFLSSASSLNLGFSQPDVRAAMNKQIDEFVQYTSAYTYNEKIVDYAKRLASVYPGGGDVKVCFGNCGSDANDAAIKFSRAFTGRQKIIVFVNGYHGNTYGAMSLSACTARMRVGMGPMLPEIYQFSFFGADVRDRVVEETCLDEMKQAFKTYLPPEEVAAVIIEPIQGDGGLLPAHPIFMKKLHELCKEHGILFISEEVQQGFYRTGEFFGIQHYGIIPDGIVMGKSIGAGTPLGAFMARSEIIDSLPAPAHVFTLGGNPLACSAGIAAFDYYQSDEFQERLERNIKLLENEADKLLERNPDIVSFRRNVGMSMGIGIDVDAGKGCDKSSSENSLADCDKCNINADATFKILFRSYQYGLCVISIAEDILRIQPPLNIKPEELKKGFEILQMSINDYRDGKIGDEVLKYRAGW